MWRDEKSFRIEAVICLPGILLSLFVPCSLAEHLFLALSLIFIMCVEALNSGIEAIVDLASPEHHELAGKAKDCASSAVFFSIISAVICWVFILAKSFGILAFF